MSSARWSWWPRPTRSGCEIDRIVTATGSAGTQAGLVAGLAAMGADIPVLGIGVRAPKDAQEANVFKLAVRHRRAAGPPRAA